MKVYSIEELHNLIVNQEIDLNEYYYDLFNKEMKLWKIVVARRIFLRFF